MNNNKWVLALILTITVLFGFNISAHASDFSQAFRAYKNGNYKEVAGLYKKACGDGNAKGCYNLGDSYVTGQGVGLNKIKAFQYFMKAAKMGNADARHGLDILCKQSPWACK